MPKPVGSALARLLEASDLARVVPELAPETLHQLIRHSGLDACGEIVALATPAQLVSVLDLDLWRNARPGRDERFDADRFGEWLELLADTVGAARIVIMASLDLELVVAGLSRHVRVFDPATFEPTAQSDDEPIEARAPHEGPECEVGGYLVRAHRADAWDAIVALLTALEADHPDLFHAVMRGVRRLSNSTPEIDGLDDLLLEPEQHLHDVALDRESRRARQGYSTPADARAFLQMARQRRAPSVNPVAAEYLRAADDVPSAEDSVLEPPREMDPELASGPPAALDAVVELLAEAGMAPPRALLAGPPSTRLALIRSLMESVRDGAPDAYLARGRELAFLANALVAGGSIQSRAFTPQEASDAAVSVCQLGLELSGIVPATYLIDHDLVTAFESGWRTLHDEVCLFAAEQLVATLSGLRWRDADVQEELDALRKELTRQLEAGTPWRARDALEVIAMIAMIDTPVWAGLLGLLDECPVMPAVLTAAVEGRTSAVSATDFEFICTRGQLGTVREFMARLPDTLRGSGGDPARLRARRKATPRTGARRGKGPSRPATARGLR